MERKDIEIGLGSYVGVVRGSTLVTGLINGIKLFQGELERVSFDEIDTWFYLTEGWKVVDMEAEDGEI